MELPSVVTSALSAALDHAFAQNDEARAALSDHVGGLLTVELTSPALSVHALVLEQSIDVLSVNDEIADATLQTDLSGLIALSRGPDALLAGKARVRGDLRLVEGIHRAVTLLAIDWEDQLAPLIGDTLAHKASTLFSRVKQDGRRNWSQHSDDMQRYLQHESGLLVSRTVWRQLTDDADTLRADIDRLAARLSRLESGE
ncbi:MAG: SCP2 sterol-binding domain-containing protein [Pseudomonadota bacterium]